MHCIYTDQARAQADLDAVNAAFEVGLAEGSQTKRWADLKPCVEGWAFEQPSESLAALCTPDSVGEITLITFTNS